MDGLESEETKMVSFRISGKKTLDFEDFAWRKSDSSEHNDYDHKCYCTVLART